MILGIGDEVVTTIIVVVITRAASDQVESGRAKLLPVMAGAITRSRIVRRQMAGSSPAMTISERINLTGTGHDADGTTQSDRKGFK
jgi:hypothetical protein